MYFESRSQAGAILADQVLEKYRYENCAVVAIGEGGVLIGEQIAVKLHCVLMMLLSEGRPTVKVPKCALSGKGCGISKTTRMLAQKQPYIQRVRNSSLVERSCAENVRG